MTFISDYFRLIDFLALVGFILLAWIAIARRENVWLGLMVLVAIIWVLSRVLGMF